jgi:hypothetical protein
MKNLKITHIFLLLALSVATLNALSQCDPLGADQCPDPENNGEVCPDTLAPGLLNLPYNVVATILPPASDTVMGVPITIHHIVLDSVGNLPTGLSWQSNAVNNEFYPGNYYCILMEGTPTLADTFHLKIYIGVFIDFFGTPVYGAQVIDSTSLSMIIIDNTGIAEKQHEGFYIMNNYPNPFTTWTSIRFFTEKPGPVEFELYSMMGKLVDRGQMIARKGENYFHYQGESLAPGTYFYLLRSGGKTVAGKFIRGH